jgi:hypothetical protein
VKTRSYPYFYAVVKNYFLKNKEVKIAPKGWIQLSSSIVKVYPKRDEKHIPFHLRTNLLVHSDKNFSAFAYLKFAQAKVSIKPNVELELDSYSFSEMTEFKFDKEILVIDIHFWSVQKRFELTSSPCNLRLLLGFEFPEHPVLCDIQCAGLVRKMYTGKYY